MRLFSYLFAIFAALVLPLGAGIWFSVRKKGYLKSVLLGALTFFVFQVLTRIPVLQLVLPNMLWYSIFSATQPVLYALFLGSTAALFEEGGRWLVMHLFMKNKHRLTDGIAFGIGHGGTEAVLLVGINLLVLLIMNGASAGALPTFLAGLERIFTLVIHIAFSIMVLKSVVLKKPVWLLTAFILHTVIDTAAVLMHGMSAFIVEGTVFVFALLLLGYTILEYKKYTGADIQ
jgi:uncharacterized membrane protein YhfC